MPTTSAWVYEHPNLGALWSEQLSDPSLRSFLRIFLHFSIQEKGEAFWKEWQAQTEVLNQFTNDLSVKISGHNLGDGRMGVVFYAPLTTSRIDALRKLFAPLHTASFNSSTRTYKGYTLHEIYSPNRKQRFAYLIGEDYFIGSFTPFLLEDVVRTISRDEGSTYLDKRPQLEDIPKIDKEGGKLYVSLRESETYWKSLSLQLDSTSRSSYSRYRGAAALLQPHVLEAQLSWSGFVSVADSLQQEFLSGFSNNSPPQLPYLHNIPNSCALVRRYGFSDARRWNLQMQSLWQRQKESLLESRLAIFSRYGIDVESLFTYVGHIAALLQIEAPIGLPEEQIFLLHLNNPKAMSKELRELTTRFSGQSSDYQETHGEYNIRYITLPNLPYLMFGNDFSGFSEIFYTYRSNFLIASSSLLTLKSVLDQLEREESWGRTPSIQQQVSQEFTDASFSVYVNLSKYWPKLSETLRHPWRTFFRKHQIQDNKPYFFSLQLQALEEKLYTQVRLYIPPLREDSNEIPLIATTKEETNTEETFAKDLSSKVEAFSQFSEELPTGYKKKASYTFDSPLISKPLLVYNPTRKQFESFVQEKTDFRLHALDRTGDIRWQAPLQERIISPIYAIDYFKDLRTQYLFATVSSIYVLNEKGETLSNFPVQLPSSDSIAYLNLVDYSKTKDYRFFVSDVRGRTYIFDKKGRALPGWDPNLLHSLSEAPFHVRVGKRDCMILPQDDGTIHMYKRVGTTYPNFPVRVGMSFAGKLYLEKSSSLRSSTFVALNSQGEILRISLTGQIKSRDPLYPTLRDAIYRLAPSVTGNGYISVAANNEELVVLSAVGKVLFQKRISLSKNFSVQYYNLGATRSLLVFRDPQQQRAYFYTLDGKDALPSSLPTSHQIALTYSKRNDSYTLHLNQGSTYLSLLHKK